MSSIILTSLIFLFLGTNTCFSKGTNPDGVKEEKKEQSLKSVSKKKKVKFFKVKVLVYKGQTLADILKRFVKDDSVIFRDERMVDITIKYNPQIKDWHNLKTGQAIYIYLDPKFIDIDKMNGYRAKLKKVTKRIRTIMETQNMVHEVKKFSTFYMASIGQFSQKNSTLAKIDFKQNSPVTLGFMYTFFPKKGNYTIASSAYFSYLLAATTNTEEDNIDLPIEIGMNSYFQYPIYKGGYYVYAGGDFEKFNTFNLTGVEGAGEINFDENQMLFLTAGFSKAFSLFKKKVLFKGSFSQSIVSSRAVGYSGDDSNDAYTGFKVMAFLLSKINKDFFLSSLFKYHVLSGPSDVSITRIGVGFGYLF